MGEGDDDDKAKKPELPIAVVKTPLGDSLGGGSDDGADDDDVDEPPAPPRQYGMLAGRGDFKIKGADSHGTITRTVGNLSGTAHMSDSHEQRGRADKAEAEAQSAREREAAANDEVARLASELAAARTSAATEPESLRVARLQVEHEKAEKRRQRVHEKKLQKEQIASAEKIALKGMTDLENVKGEHLKEVARINGRTAWISGAALLIGALVGAWIKGRFDVEAARQKAETTSVSDSGADVAETSFTATAATLSASASGAPSASASHTAQVTASQWCRTDCEQKRKAARAKCEKDQHDSGTLGISTSANCSVRADLQGDMCLQHCPK